MPAGRYELQPRYGLVFGGRGGPELRDGSRWPRRKAPQARQGTAAMPVGEGRQPKPYRGPSAGIIALAAVVVILLTMLG